MRIYEQHDYLDQTILARNKLAAVTKFSEQSYPKLECCTVFSLYLKQFSIRASQVPYSLFKDDFFPNWILSESSITEQFHAVFPLSQANIKLCIITYDSVFQTFLRCSHFCLISLPATLPFPPAFLLPRHQHLHFSSAGEQKQAVITVCKYLLTPTS